VNRQSTIHVHLITIERSEIPLIHVGKAADTGRRVRSPRSKYFLIAMIMNRSVTHISKALALLAIMLLPVQQSLAATCCCHGGRGVASQTIVGPQRNCCSQREASYRGRASSLGWSCCEANSPGSKSKPCQCPGECCQKVTPNAVDPVAVRPSLEEDLPVATVLGISTIACENTTRNSQVISVANSSTSGSERCIQLCRYRL
jgi:hypothetical protein